MNTLFFKYALEVERTRSITQAAENMFMAQPNLSRAIKEMEDTLGFPIFERTSKGVVPTVKGTTFLKYARSIVKQLAKMEAINDLPNDDVQRLSISYPRSSYISDGITNLLGDLDPEKPMELNLKETNSVSTINNIQNGKFKLGIIRYRSSNEPYFKNFLKDKHMYSDVIWEYECVVLMSKNNPLAESPEIHPFNLKKLIEVTHGDISVPYVDAEAKRDSLDCGTDKKIYIYDRCSQYEILSKLPSTFMWVSPIPEHLVNKYGLIQRKCSFDSNQFKDVLIYSDDYKLTKLDKRFIERLYESKTEVCYKEYR